MRVNYIVKGITPNWLRYFQRKYGTSEEANEACRAALKHYLDDHDFKENSNYNIIYSRSVGSYPILKIKVNDRRPISSLETLERKLVTVNFDGHIRSRMGSEVYRQVVADMNGAFSAELLDE